MFSKGKVICEKFSWVTLPCWKPVSQALGTKTSELYAVAESESEGGEEAASDQSNEVILVRRNFQALTPKNRRLAIEFLKLLG